MSRRRGEFEHRTSIFEGAFRAWSHLGGLAPELLEARPAADLDPLVFPIENDPRIKGNKIKNGSHRRDYPYEPLPRSGLAHPYVQAILSPWLGPDADNEAIQLGLTTLRTWWQHRRKGESGSAVAALGTDKMKGVVEGYTRHFFTLAHCLIINDKEQPPRTLHSRMKELDKNRNKRNNKRIRDDQDPMAVMALNGAFSGSSDDHAHGINPDPANSGLSPLERLHAAQQRQLAESGGVHSSLPGPDGGTAVAMFNMKGKCVPGKLDLHGIVDTVNHHAAQLSHRGGSALANQGGSPQQYGDPTTTPVVFVSERGDIQIAMSVDGITCAHCVKIVETVLRGCNGNKSPIDGLLDAAADRVLNSILIKIDRASNAKRIAFEAARNLSMVGYTAKAKEMSIVGQGADKKATMDLGALATAFEVVANCSSEEVFDWNIPCTCPDNGVLREDCSRHSQMNVRLFEAFEARAQAVKNYMAGCGSKYNMPSSNNHTGESTKNHLNMMNGNMNDPYGGMAPNGNGTQPQVPTSLNVNNYNDMGNGMYGVNTGMNLAMNDPRGLVGLNGMGGAEDQMGLGNHVSMPMRGDMRRMLPQQNATRNPSIISFGGLGGLRGNSFTSEVTFGRAMSSLSALSIDWENLEDFDVNVDHSAHINNAPLKNQLVDNNPRM